jgi:hypothetical protein
MEDFYLMASSGLQCRSIAFFTEFQAARARRTLIVQLKRAKAMLNLEGADSDTGFDLEAAESQADQISRKETSFGCMAPFAFQS